MDVGTRLPDRAGSLKDVTDAGRLVPISPTTSTSPCTASALGKHGLSRPEWGRRTGDRGLQRPRAGRSGRRRRPGWCRRDRLLKRIADRSRIPVERRRRPRSELVGGEGNAFVCVQPACGPVEESRRRMTEVATRVFPSAAARQPNVLAGARVTLAELGDDLLAGSNRARRSSAVP